MQVVKVKVRCSNIDCSGDFVKLYNYRNNEMGSELASVCGSRNVEVMSDTDSVFIRFTSDASTTGSGFRITYIWKKAPKGTVAESHNPGRYTP